MRKNHVLFLALIATLATVFVSCKKTNDDTVFTSYSQYNNFKVGKYIIYALDSTVTRSFGTSFIRSSHIVKDSIVEEIVDNSNRKTFKVFRYHLNQANNTWQPINTFFFTPTDNSLEYVENNLRYIKMVSPVEEGKSWLGNSYLSQPVFHQNSFYQTWNFFYKDAGQPMQVGTFNLPKTVTVVQYDSTDNKEFSAFAFATYDKGYEIYADTIGLVYRDVISWEYQPTLAINNCKHTYPNPSGTGTVTTPVNCDLPGTNCDSLRALANHKVVCDTVVASYYYNGYGTKQVMLSHN